MQDMIIEFYLKADQKPTSTDINNFELYIGKTLPVDYREHMLNVCNGGIPKGNYYHVNYPDEGSEIRKLYPIKYGSTPLPHESFRVV